MTASGRAALPVLLLLIGFAAYAIRLGPEASWDLRNYHLYIADAYLRGRTLDLVPAQMQSFHAPTLDIALASLRAACAGHPALLIALMAAPHAACAALAYAIGRHVLAGWGAWRLPAALGAAILGATGAAALPTLAGSMSEAPVAAFLLAAVLILLRDPARAGLAGVCLGLAFGLKLTAAGPCLGVALAHLATTRPRWPGAARLALGGLAGALLAGGWWWLHLWRATGNPLFPYFNDLFASPLLDPVRIADRRFLPRSWLQALFYPFWWAWQPQTLANELPAADPRLALAEFAALALAAAPLLRRTQPDRTRAFLLITASVAYAAWALQFGILRYLAFLEFLTGPILLLAVRDIVGRAPRTIPFAAALCFAAIALTTYPDWGRARADPAAVASPDWPPDARVVLLDGAPMAYLARAAPPSVAFIGASNNLVRPGDRTGLAQRIAAAIAADGGPLWGLESPAESPGQADATLRAHHLHRTDCAQVRSDLDNDAIRACRLARD